LRQNDADAKVKTKRYLLGPVEKPFLPSPSPEARRSACQFSAKLTITELMMSLPLGQAQNEAQCTQHGHRTAAGCGCRVLHKSWVCTEKK